MSEFVYKNGKKLRCGYTTGTCAAAAAKCASRILLGLNEDASVLIRTPGGKTLELPVTVLERSDRMVLCGVRKDAGDDADVTDGLMICASVTLRPPTGAGLQITGGEGVGRVTRPGLDRPVGEAAINSVPRQMIREALTEAAEEAGYTGGFHVVISAPGGDEIAMRTFNPRLGIEGGISILGTSGIVEPMSDQAVVDTIRAQISVRMAEGAESIFITPGNYGEEFIREETSLELDAFVKCSNFIGDALDIAAQAGAKRLLLVGHIGKLVKLGSGIMNTHSRFADGRMETLASCILLAGGDAQTARNVLSCNTTEDAVELMREAGCLDGAMEVLSQRIEDAMSRHVYGRMGTGAVFFSRQSGLCVIGKNAERIFGNGLFCRSRVGSD
jgi:cobalt-precorrin-5B (C1)-methyltransferase